MNDSELAAMVIVVGDGLAEGTIALGDATGLTAGEMVIVLQRFTEFAVHDPLIKPGVIEQLPQRGGINKEGRWWHWTTCYSPLFAGAWKTTLLTGKR